MGTMATQITSLTIVYSTVIQAQIKENIKAPRHWPLCGEFTGTGEFPAQRASNAKNASIWWRLHVKSYHRLKQKKSLPISIIPCDRYASIYVEVNLH